MEELCRGYYDHEASHTAINQSELDKPSKTQSCPFLMLCLFSYLAVSTSIGDHCCGYILSFGGASVGNMFS